MRSTQKTVAVLTVVTLLASYAIGRIYAQAQCSHLCENINCHTWPADATKPCRLTDPTICETDFWMRDPPGGQCQQFTLTTLVFKCPECNPECINDPAEATGCQPATPGCAPGQCCDSVKDKELPARWACNQGTV